ncbi:MAG: acyltransferase [Deltaproteobacteria bacterium]|nr:acyltransferase [Deltaproteobacteria bacterium]
MEFVQGLWLRAEHMARLTPDSRNRFVDFLRAASIGVVILGHWLVAAPSLGTDGSVVPGHMLAIAPWTQWLTLVLQVMPIFFLVGGYANAIAWQAAERKNVAYGDWLAARFRRLVRPVIPVLLLWTAIALTALGFGLPGEWVGTLSQVALVPTWFLAVYVMVGVVVPWTHRAWKRFGFASFAALVAGAIGVDVLCFASGVREIGLLNYGFVWLAIHQLGYAWRDDRLHGRLLWAGAGALTTALLVWVGPYPLAMVGVPGAELSNTSPPTLALLALGVCQAGVVLHFEPFARRMLDHASVWTATVLVNGIIMSLYLWHMTVMIGVYAIDAMLGGISLTLLPDSAAWWLSRPLVMFVLLAVLLPFVGIVAHFERPAAAILTASRRRLVPGAAMVCTGLALISEYGVVSANGLRLVPTLLPILGTGIAGFGPLGRILGGVGSEEVGG